MSYRIFGYAIGKQTFFELTFLQVRYFQFDKNGAFLHPGRVHHS